MALAPRKYFTRFALFMLIIALVGVFCCKGRESYYATEVPFYMPATDFTLTDQHLRPFHLGDHRGKVILLFFGYTFCPDVCPQTLSSWQQAYALLGGDTSQVVLAYLTVDPERDSPARLRHYLESFSVPVFGLSGDSSALKSVYAAYHIFREREAVDGSAAGYLYGHTASTLVIDQKGLWKLRIPYGSRAEEIAHDIKLLIRANSP